LDNLNIEIDSETGSRGLRDIIFLAYSEKLTTYDATYLDLAMRYGLLLATKDTALIQAAKRVGVKTV
jgi:predicted nucleic acid-binding protein